MSPGAVRGSASHDKTMAITSQMVRDLRDRTGAGMMECKKALEASGGDPDEAIVFLRKSGLKKAEKKAERSTAEGRVFAVPSNDGHRIHMVGVACETDFLASSEKFRGFVSQLETHVARMDPTGVEDGPRPMLDQPLGGEGAAVRDALKEAAGSFGENTRITAVARLENPEGQVGAYVHHDNKQGAVVSVTTAADAAKASEVLKALCQHIVVFRPQYANREDVPASEVERERELILSADDMKSKPEGVREKMVVGRLNSFYAGCVLADQPWILNDKTSTLKALEEALGKGCRIQAFRRVQLS
jgi:elongation factor Ts